LYPTFLAEVEQEAIQCCQIDFLNGTSNASLAYQVCGICAQQQNTHDLDTISLDSIPYLELLKPTTDHPSQILRNGMLLTEDAIED